MKGYRAALQGWLRQQRRLAGRTCLRAWLSFCWIAPRNPRWLGVWGELQALDWIRAEGGKLLKANFRARQGGEADLVVRDGEILAFVEVKTRRSVAKGRPAAAVGQAKRRLLMRAAYGWLRMLGEKRSEVAWRIDVVEVIVSERGRVGEIRWNKGGT